jgi:hypothetical protein
LELRMLREDFSSSFITMPCCIVLLVKGRALTMNRRQYAIAVSFSISLLAAALVPLSGQQGSSYNPWLDYNDDGIINVEDLHALGSVYGTSGAPLNLPMALEYDSPWIDISDKQGQFFDVTPGFNLETSTWFPRIYGKVAADTPVHQKYWYGYDMPGWNKTYGGTSSDCGRSVVQTSDGGYALAGYTGSFGAGSYDFWLVKTDSAGTMQWNQTYGEGTYDDRGESVVQTSDGGFALVGSTRCVGGSQPTFYDVCLVKTDESGTMEWQHVPYRGTSHDYGYSLVQTIDGGYAIAGMTSSFGSMYQLYLAKTDELGTMIWQRAYGGAGYDGA